VGSPLDADGRRAVVVDRPAQRSDAGRVVQTASSLPVLLVRLPAGVVAEQVRNRYGTAHLVMGAWARGMQVRSLWSRFREFRTMDLRAIADPLGRGGRSAGGARRPAPTGRPRLPRRPCGW
jgi:hypothetical protein